MAYVVIKNNNRQSYTLKNTANKPRVVIKSNGSSYIPLKAGTDTKATRLGFNINGAHYKAGGETSTTSIQSNTTYTYFGAQTYKTSKYPVQVVARYGRDYKTFNSYQEGTYTTSNLTFPITVSILSANKTVYISDGGNNYYRSISANGASYRPSSSGTITYQKMYYTTNYPTYVSGTYQTSHDTLMYITISFAYSYEYSRQAFAYGYMRTYAYVYNVTSNMYVDVIPIEAYVTGYNTVYSTSYYDYGYNVEVGNTTTTVQTTTEV